MIPQPNDIVIVVFRTGIQLEGKVISWSDQKSVLKSQSNSSTIVINKTLDDILFYKISHAQKEYDKLLESPIKQDNIKDLAQLKTELNELEKAEIRDRLNTHTIGEIKPVHYGIPSIAQIKSPQQHSGTEVAQQNSGISSELRNLFQKKY